VDNGDTLRKSRIRYVDLTCFKGFERARADLGSFTVIVGTNASGKSNLRDAFRFLHGISRGYTLAEIVGEKWIEGGVLQWRGIRGGLREVAYNGSAHFTVRVGLRLSDQGSLHDAHYQLKALVDPSGTVTVDSERLVIVSRNDAVFDSHPDKHAPAQPDQPHHLAVRLMKTGKSRKQGQSATLLSDRPALVQLAEGSEKVPAEVRLLCREARDALASMRFLDLVPDAMRMPSSPSWVVGWPCRRVLSLRKVLNSDTGK